MKPIYVLASLSDGAWHTYDELSIKTRISKAALLSILRFFSEYGFVEVDTGKESAKLDSSYMKL